MITSPDTGVNAKLLSDLVIELNITRRNFLSYPKGHPVIAASIDKTIITYNQMFSQQNELVIGVARDALMSGETVLDRKIHVFRDFAKVLHEHGIGALQLRPGLKSDELLNFNIILSLKREEILKFGGISALWEKSGITSINIKPVQYDLFTATETDSISVDNQQIKQTGIWESFVQELIKGSPGTTSGPADSNPHDDNMDPLLLAALVNRQMEAAGYGSEIDFSGLLSSFEQKSGKATLPPEAITGVPYDKLALFINKLNPELRRRLLNNSFDIKSLSGISIGEELLPRLSDDAMSDTLEDVRHDRLKVSPVVMELIQKLSQNSANRKYEEIARQDEDKRVQLKIRKMFIEYDAENQLPETYQDILNRIVTTRNTRRIEETVVNELLSTLDSHIFEKQLSNIILQLITLEKENDQNRHLNDTLNEVYIYLLQTGDYEQLINLIEQCNTPEASPSAYSAMKSCCTSKECLEEILVGLTNWGKPKYDIIMRLIRLIGPSFIEPLLDRLATEESLSLRRFMMDRIQEFGLMARIAIIERLSDNRWFVLRNLIIMLRTMNDSSIVDNVRPLIHHNNLKVRQEAMRTCLHFQDPTAERQVLYDMASTDHQTQLYAINLAEKSRSVDVYKKLLAILAKPGLSNLECELKSAAIQALGEIARPDAIPELAKILAAKSLLYSKPLGKLKNIIISSLRHYPANIGGPVLQRLAEGSGETATQAAAVLKLISENNA